MPSPAATAAVQGLWAPYLGQSPLLQDSAVGALIKNVRDLLNIRKRESGTRVQTQGELTAELTAVLVLVARPFHEAVAATGAEQTPRQFSRVWQSTLRHCLGGTTLRARYQTQLDSVQFFEAALSGIDPAAEQRAESALRAQLSASFAPTVPGDTGGGAQEFMIGTAPGTPRGPGGPPELPLLEVPSAEADWADDLVAIDDDGYAQAPEEAPGEGEEPSAAAGLPSTAARPAETGASLPPGPVGHGGSGDDPGASGAAPLTRRGRRLME